MTIWISRELPLFNFERINILCAWIGHQSEMLWPFEFLEIFRCSISSISIYYFPESDIRVKSYDQLNFSRDDVVQFRAFRYIMPLNWTSESIVMTIWTSREVPLFNFDRLDILFAWIGHPVKSYDKLNFSRASVAKCRSSRYIMRLNRTSEWKVMTIWIFRELPLFDFESLGILFPGNGHPCEKLCPSEFLESFRCSISSISIYYFPESDIRVKSYDHLNFSRDSVVQLRASRYTMRLNWTSE